MDGQDVIVTVVARWRDQVHFCRPKYRGVYCLKGTMLRLLEPFTECTVNIVDVILGFAILSDSSRQNFCSVCKQQ